MKFYQIMTLTLQYEMSLQMEPYLMHNLTSLIFLQASKLNRIAKFVIKLNGIFPAKDVASLKLNNLTNKQIKLIKQEN